jgi:DNA replication protein DnaC
MLKEQNWFPAGETMKCSKCRDKEAFNAYQSRSLDELRDEVGKRLVKDYFLLPESLMNAGFKNFEKTNNITSKAKENAMNYTKSFLADEFYNLLIMGNPGTGKSHLCAAIGRTLIEKGYSVGFLTSGKLLGMIKKTYGKGAPKSEDDVLKDIKKLDLFILDDIGSEAIGGNDDWRKGMIFEIVECRSGKPTIYTSNVAEIDLGNAVGNRVYSRLYDNTKFIDMFIEDYDYRKKFTKN